MSHNTIPAKEFAEKHPQSLIGRAYVFSKKAHSKQKRSSGEPFFAHIIATAEVLRGWGMDEATIAAGLLHDTVEDTPTTIEDIEKEFGKDIAFLVDGVTKLDRLTYSGTEKQAENLRKLILALSEDLRVIFIKLADRKNNMETLDALPKEKQKRIALETDEIYAPLAYRLGMQQISGELRDLAFPYLHAEEAKWIEKNVSARYEERLDYLKRIKPIILKTLKEGGVEIVNTDFRAKRISSLYQKLLRNGMDIEQIFDLVAMRIVVPNVEGCYAALGVIHSSWPPLPGRIKDYVALPKANGYQSLHTTVIGPENTAVELQIRTPEMHLRAERGVAAHWAYKDSKKKDTRSPKDMAADLEWLKELKNWQKVWEDPSTTPEDFLESMKVNFFRHRIFPLTPRGEALDLPIGATPIDFAYRIHSDVGDSCVGAKVNGRIVPLDHELQSGDLVEIITQKGKKPSEDWLAIVRTASAREHIRTALHKRKGPKLVAEFKVVVEDREGLIKDISATIARNHLSILSLHTDVAPGGRYPIDKLRIDTADQNKIEKLALKLKKVQGVKQISWKMV